MVLMFVAEYLDIDYNNIHEFSYLFNVSHIIFINAESNFSNAEKQPNTLSNLSTYNQYFTDYLPIGIIKLSK